jgi:hypothetical protein
MALEKIENIRTDILFDYVKKMNLEENVTPNFYKDIALKHISKEKYNDASLIIHEF